MRNFAKWYAFNHTRILAMKTAGGIAFSTLDATSRVGFNTINTYLQNFLNVQDFTAANKTAWFTNFYSVVPTGSTPTIDAMAQIGEYFSNRDTFMPGVTFVLDPRPALPGAADPLDAVTGRCQSNYHLLSTDGYWNQRATIVYRCRRRHRRPGPDRTRRIARPDPRLYTRPALPAAVP